MFLHQSAGRTFGTLASTLLWFSFTKRHAWTACSRVESLHNILLLPFPLKTPAGIPAGPAAPLLRREMRFITVLPSSSASFINYQLGFKGFVICYWPSWWHGPHDGVRGTSIAGRWCRFGFITRMKSFWFRNRVCLERNLALKWEFY